MSKEKHRTTVTDESSPLFDEMDRIRTCSLKKAYDSEWHAKYTIDDSMEKFGIKLNSYRCPYCGKWHLTERA